MATPPYGPSNSMQVELANGTLNHEPPPDLTVYNPSGDAITFRRGWTNNNATRQYGTPGLAKGWTLSFDARLTTEGMRCTWHDLQLVWPNGSQDILTVELDDDDPTGMLIPPAGSGYVVEGDPGPNIGEWFSVRFTFKDGTQWEFAPHETGVYALTALSNRMGSRILLEWDESRRLRSFTDEVSETELLTLHYDADGYLWKAVDFNGRMVVFNHLEYEDPYTGAELMLLESVSQIVDSQQAAWPMRWRYEYVDVPAMEVESPTNWGNQDDCAYDGYEHVPGVDSFWTAPPAPDERVLLMTAAAMPGLNGDEESVASVVYYEDFYNVAERIDANGNHSYYAYGDGETVVTIFDPDGNLAKTWTTEYNEDGSETGSTCAGCPTSYEYDDPDNPTKPTKIIAADGKETTFTYDDYGNTLTTTDARGVTLTNTYDYTNFPLGRLVKVERTVDTTTITLNEYTYYEPSGLQHTVKSLKPGTTTGELVTSAFTYDDLGNPLTVVSPGNDAAATLTTTFGYESDGGYSQPAKVQQPLYVEDGLGNRTHFRYDARGNRTEVVDALGHGSLVAYNLANQIVRTRQVDVMDGSDAPLLCVELTRVGEPGNLLTATASVSLQQVDSSGEAAHDWAQVNLPLVVAAPFSQTTLAFALPLSPDQQYLLDDVAILLNGASGTWDEDNHWLATVQTRSSEMELLDTIGSATFATAGPGLVQVEGLVEAATVNTYLYTGGPQTRMQVIDGNGQAVQTINTAYGLEGETLAVTGGTEEVAYQYNALYQQTALTDGNGNTTTFAYDTKNRLKLIRYPLATADDGYDTIRYTLYDDANRVLRRIDGQDQITDYTYNDPGGLLTAVDYDGHASESIAIGYDDLGRKVSMTDAEGSHAYTYDDRGTMLSHTVTYTGLSAKTVSYTYHPNGSRATLTHPGDSLTYHYDEAGRMTSLAYGLGTASWDHYANGLIARQTLPNGAWTDYAYDGANRIRQLINKDPSGAVLAAYGDTDYLPTGDLAAWTAEVTGQANQSGAIAYDYDRKRRLIEETSTRLGGYDYDNTFDDAGNALEFRNDPHTYNADNQLVGPGTYVYDGNGNPTTWDGTALTWNVENRMTAYGTALTAGYRGDGLRAWKQPGGGNPTYFLYDGISVLCELDHTGAVSASSTYGANGLLSRGTTEYQFDPLGDAVLLLDGAGAVTARQVFDGWGNALTGALGPFGYRGRYGYYADSETGMVALAYRHYSPAVGRLLQRDLVGYRGGVDLYAYVASMPISAADPLGLVFGIDDALLFVFFGVISLAAAAAQGLVSFLIDEYCNCNTSADPWLILGTAAATFAAFAGLALGGNVASMIAGAAVGAAIAGIGSAIAGGSVQDVLVSGVVTVVAGIAATALAMSIPGLGVVWAAAIAGALAGIMSALLLECVYKQGAGV